MTKPQKPKARNFVAKNARNMSGAGAHQDKKGKKANRARQKSAWKRDINENFPLPSGIEGILKKAFGDVRVDMSPGDETNATDITVRFPNGKEGNWQIDRQTGETIDLGGVFQIGTHEQKQLFSLVSNRIGSMIKKEKSGKPSMLKTMNESVREYDPFEFAIKVVEKKFNISLDEGISKGNRVVIKSSIDSHNGKTGTVVDVRKQGKVDSFVSGDKVIYKVRVPGGGVFAYGADELEVVKKGLKEGSCGSENEEGDDDEIPVSQQYGVGQYDWDDDIEDRDMDAERDERHAEYYGDENEETSDEDFEKLHQSNFDTQQYADMKKLIKQYRTKSDLSREDIANDLEMLEYRPTEIPNMVRYITHFQGS